MRESFTCERCGNCCRGEGFVYVTPEDIRRISAYLNLNDLEFRDQYTYLSDRRTVLTSHANHDCIFYEDNSCTIHKVKPAQCVAWPFWREIEANEEEFDTARQTCAGLRHLDYGTFRKAAEAYHKKQASS